MTDPNNEAAEACNNNHDFDAFDPACPLCNGTYSEEWLAEIAAAAEAPGITMTADQFSDWLRALLPGQM